MRGGLSLYSFSQNQPTLSILNEEPINEDIEFKTLDGKRNYDLFRRIISDQNKVRSFTSPDFKYEEADILVVKNASNGFTKELFYSYNQFLKTKVKKHFSDDAYVQFLSLVNNYKKTCTCPVCSNLLKEKDNIRICKICFNIYHISCLNDNIKSTKQWSCNAC